MSNHSPWLFDEFKPPGRDYGAEDQAAMYDETHARFRNLQEEARAALDLLALRPGAVIVEYGTGTGAFAVEAAKRGATVHALDVSEAMMRVARQKAAAAGVENRITFHHQGFLTYTHTGAQADAVASTLAFHHLPDFWKGVALQRMRASLPKGGRLYLRDVILEAPNALDNIAAFIGRLAEKGGDFLREDAEGHFREEYSTYDWVMEGLFERAAFSVINRSFEDGVIGTYLCIAI